MGDKALARREDYQFHDELAGIDPDISLLIEREEARQAEKLIMIPSESIAPRAVRAALGSVFTNLYAEGYPALRMTREEEAHILDLAAQLAAHRRYADRRFYKGTEIVDVVEALAQRRVAALFATKTVPAAQIFANVQALSGAAANNAVYSALLQPGDTLLGLALSHGGHLTHGSAFNRSGRYYNVVPYYVSEATGRIDYDALRVTALANRPKILVAGASAYPWDIDWARLRRVADEAGALLLADIAHPAGLVPAGLFPNPVGHAQVVTFTTHKTLCGPRGAVILTADEALARRIDLAVFPGEQGGPHVNNIAAMAVAFRIAQSPRFHALQRQIVANARALAAALAALGQRLVYGGTNTHLLLVDLNALPSPTGFPLKGEPASRILDLAGIVCNKNTIPGDLNAAQASGLRFGTVWATQRGLGEHAMTELAAVIHRVLASIVPFGYAGPAGLLGRGKLPFAELSAARRRIMELLEGLPDRPKTAPPAEVAALEISGPRARTFLQEACGAHLLDLAPGESRPTTVFDREGKTIARASVRALSTDHTSRERLLLFAPPAELSRLRDWLEALSDGYVLFDSDVYRKVDGPVSVLPAALAGRDQVVAGEGVDRTKPFFVGQSKLLAQEQAPAVAEFRPVAYAGPPRRSCLYEEHVALAGGRNIVPFAGWLMPLWYTSIREEHRAVREAAGLFDLSHMGVLDIAGPGAARFLDLVTTNYVRALAPGQAHYSYILDPRGAVLDDVFLYCRSRDRYMLVVNAANAEQIESWLGTVASRRFTIDSERPRVAVDAVAEIRSLKGAGLGAEGRVDLALQGPRSLDVLRAAVEDPALAGNVARLRKGELVEGTIGGIPALISRTGYTGEEVGFELYVPPEQAPAVWRLLLAKGNPLGLRPVGLGARDALRAEAGFPLYGHELAGPFAVSPAGAGYAQFVKLHKPFFIGRSAYIETERNRDRELARFCVGRKGAPMLHMGDPVVDQRGEVIGHVTTSVVVEGRQVGMAYLARVRADTGSAVWAFPLSRLKLGGEKPTAQLAIGDSTTLPVEATILSRFGLQARAEADRAS